MFWFLCKLNVSLQFQAVLVPQKHLTVIKMLQNAVWEFFTLFSAGLRLCWHPHFGRLNHFQLVATTIFHHLSVGFHWLRMAFNHDRSTFCYDKQEREEAVREEKERRLGGEASPQGSAEKLGIEHRNVDWTNKTAKEAWFTYQHLSTVFCFGTLSWVIICQLVT